MRRRRRLRRVAITVISIPLVAWLAFNAAVAWWAYPKDVAQTPPSSTIYLDRNGVELAAVTAPDGQWRLPLREDEISPHLMRAIVAVEDARFYEHAGVDWRAGLAAAWQDVSSLRVRRGASTLTMQLHRLRDPAPRSFAAKLEQLVRARQIEQQQSKQDILVEYLNRAPFGGNLTGAGAASWRYFGKSCRDLSLGEAALLAGLPQSPNRVRPDRHPERAARRRSQVLQRMLACGMISPTELAQAEAEPIQATWRPLPQERITQHHPPADGALPALLTLSGTRARTVTTLDAAVQRQACDAAVDHLDRLRASGVTSAAVVVLDTDNAECLAAVSVSSIDAKNVDLTRRPRSSGSVLKPLIYASAFEAGLCTPQTIIDDSPAAWPGYAPQDYDRKFRGQLTVAEAMAESRNIPAMLVLADVGVGRATQTMRAAGLRSVGRDGRAYGLSLAVGGAEVTPMELASAYAGLARGGIARDPVMVCGQRTSAEKDGAKFLSPAACWQVFRALSDADRTSRISREAATLGVAWKTGTSSGNRDAWCAATTPRKTVVVWLGNPRGESSAALVGREAAAPLALQIIASIEHTPANWPNPRARASSDRVAQNRSVRALGIVSPAPGREILMSDDVPTDRQRVPLRAAGAAADDVHWFIDGEHVAAGSIDGTSWWSPAPGRHEVRAVDAVGHAARVTVSVRAH